MTGLEETFRRVLAARLPDDPKWATWIDGAVAELAAAGVVLTPEEATLALAILHTHAVEYTEQKAARMETLSSAIATRLGAS